MDTDGRVDHDEYRAMKRRKYISEQDWSNLLSRMSKIEQNLERMQDDGTIHDHHADGGPS